MPATWTTNGWTVDNTQFSYWGERDRQHAHLMDTNGKSILSVWDEAVNELVEDGFLKAGTHLHESMADYANHLDLQEGADMQIHPSVDNEMDYEDQLDMECGGGE